MYWITLLQLVCLRSDVYASVCAIAKAYSLYSRKSSIVKSDRKQVVTIEVILAGNDPTPLSPEDVSVRSLSLLLFTF